MLVSGIQQSDLVTYIHTHIYNIYIHILNVSAKSLSHVWLFATPRTVACQAPLSVGFSWQKYWSGLPFPPPGESSWSRGRTHVSYISCTGRQIPYRLSLPGSHILNQKLSGSASKLAPVTHWVPIFPGGANGKESAPQCRRHNRSKFHVWVAKIPLEEGMATHSNILAQRIPWTEEPGGLQSIGLQRIRHDWNDLHAPRHPLSMTTAVLEGLQNTLHTLSYLILIKLNKVSIAFI